MDDVDVGNGTVGGYVVSWAADGKIAAGMALRILDGAKPQEIPIVEKQQHLSVRLASSASVGIQGKRPSTRKHRDFPRIVRMGTHQTDLDQWAADHPRSYPSLTVYLQFSRRQLKQARESQLQLSGLLINAQEMERRRLASELHDDFSQRVALLALGLENASEALLDSIRGAKRQLHELFDSASELGADLHTVSHRLHPSALESLGLAPGVDALCKEFSARQGIRLIFLPRTFHMSCLPT